VITSVVRDFLMMLDKACKQVRDTPKRPAKTQIKEAHTVAASSDTRQSPDLSISGFFQDSCNYRSTDR
jgi:hypothetical protein